MGVACSRYHAWATEKLLDGAIERWRRLGGRDANLIVAPATGAWELTGVVRALAGRGDIEGLVALGVLIRGETPHFDFICRGVTRGLTSITLATGKPVGFGVLTCETRGQVEARCGGDAGNKGAEAMEAAVDAALTIRTIATGGDREREDAG